MSKAEKFLREIDSRFKMITRDELLEMINEGDVEIIDLRGAKAFHTTYIEESINIELRSLPGKIQLLNPKKKIVAVCNGSVQSAYAIYFLYIMGFEHVYNLSGGIQGCINNNFPLLKIERQ